MRNGVQARAPAAFEPRFRSGVPAKIEGALAAAVIAAVLAIFYWLLVKLPGPLVVHVEDDTHQGVMNAKVVCEGPDGKRFSGLTDVFGEAKWPGLAQGAWRCEALPPPKFHTGTVVGYATVVPRKPAMWMARLERPATAVVQVVRPRGQPRAAPAIRALCRQVAGEDAPPTWEARAGLLDGRATLYLPHGRACRLGLVRPELPAGQPGPVAIAKLACDAGPCTPELRGGVGEELHVVLAPNPAQWEAARPPPEPD
ncbi:MAG: hypothetical protein E6J64_13450 [Deltaproteobacteria bacterium]|nr:MAG: hypothetical protein E6J64_13450 [Deltaproteobacteria bacterium]